MIIMGPLNLSSQILEMSSRNSNCLDILSWHIKNLISTSGSGGGEGEEGRWVKGRWGEGVCVHVRLVDT